MSKHSTYDSSNQKGFEKITRKSKEKGKKKFDSRRRKFHKDKEKMVY